MSGAALLVSAPPTKAEVRTNLAADEPCRSDRAGYANRARERPALGGGHRTRVDTPSMQRTREILEFVALFAVAGLILAASAMLPPGWRGVLSAAVALWASVKTFYYFAETLRHLIDATAMDLAYHRFLVLVAYNMAQITLSYAIDFYCLYWIDPANISGIETGMSGATLMFECFYFSVLNFSFFGYGDIIPARVPGKIVMLLEVVTAFSTVIFLLSDFVSMKESMRKRPGSPAAGRGQSAS